MSSDSRTLVTVFMMLGLASSCCLCTGVVGAIAVRAAARVREAADRVRAKQLADQRLLEQAERMGNQPKPALPPAPPTPVRPAVEATPPLPRLPEPEVAERTTSRDASPEADLAEKPKAARKRPAPLRPKIESKLRELDGIAEAERRTIYRAATIADQVETSMRRQLDERRARGVDTSRLEGMMRERQARRPQDLERISSAFRIRRDDLEKIVAEGKQKGW